MKAGLPLVLKYKTGDNDVTVDRIARLRIFQAGIFFMLQPFN